MDLLILPKKFKRDRHYFDNVSSISRKAVNEEMEEITIKFEAGGTVTIVTSHPLLWTAPEVH